MAFHDCRVVSMSERTAKVDVEVFDGVKRSTSTIYSLARHTDMADVKAQTGIFQDVLIGNI